MKAVLEFEAPKSCSECPLRCNYELCKNDTLGFFNACAPFCPLKIIAVPKQEEVESLIRKMLKRYVGKEYGPKLRESIRKKIRAIIEEKWGVPKFPISAIASNLEFEQDGDKISLINASIKLLNEKNRTIVHYNNLNV